jgi:hypothetical protein
VGEHKPQNGESRRTTANREQFLQAVVSSAVGHGRPRKEDAPKSGAPGIVPRSCVIVNNVAIGITKNSAFCAYPNQMCINVAETKMSEMAPCKARYQRFRSTFRMGRRTSCDHDGERVRFHWSPSCDFDHLREVSRAGTVELGMSNDRESAVS